MIKVNGIVDSICAGGYCSYVACGSTLYGMGKIGDELVKKKKNECKNYINY